MPTDITFTVAKALESDWLFVAASPDSDEPYAPFTRWFQYIVEGPEGWTHHDVDWWAVSAETYIPPESGKSGDWALVGLSQEGDVELTYADSSCHEHISGSGVFSESAQGWGYMASIRQIGDHLYACGSGGQVYKRLARDRWEHLDNGLLQSLPISDRLLLNSINGLADDSIFVCGSFPGSSGLEGRLFHFNGSDWRPLPIPEVGYLNSIHIESSERIWVCGHNGALLLGNARDGFKDLSSVEDNQLFYSLTLFNGKVYLASNLGLFAYDPADLSAGIRKVITGLMPELQDAHVVDACDGVLWSIGEKDIARFDGKQWVRVDHPDNPPIR